MFHDEKGNLVSKEVLFERMRKHIHTIVNRYKDVVYAWDVVNEAMTDDPKAEVPYRQSLYYKIAGDEFIKKALNMLMRQIPKHCFSTMIIMRPTRRSVTAFIIWLKA